MPNGIRRWRRRKWRILHRRIHPEWLHQNCIIKRDTDSPGINGLNRDTDAGPNDETSCYREDSYTTVSGTSYSTFNIEGYKWITNISHLLKCDASCMQSQNFINLIENVFSYCYFTNSTIFIVHKQWRK